MRIRPATKDDIAAMHGIRVAVRENRLADPESVQPSHYEAMLGRRGKGWVAEQGEQIIGFAIADLLTETVWALFVAPDREGRGVGRALHRVMVEWFFEQGLDSVSLTTSPGTRAQTFYTAAGWRCVGAARDGEFRYELTRSSWGSVSRKSCSP